MNTELQETIKKISQVYGRNVIKRLDEVPMITDDIISTGIMGLDMALGVGGIRKGSIVEIYAPESAGKTTLTLQLCKQYQKFDMPVLYIDSERTLTRETIEGMGINTDNFYMSNVGTLEDALEICRISAQSFGVIVLDSLPGLVPKAQLDGDIGDSHVGIFSKIMSDALPILTSVLAENKCTLIVINQIREKVGVLFGNPERVTGGRALKYYASVRLDIRRTETLKHGGESIGDRIRVKVVKNKIAAPFKVIEFDLIFGKGISVEGDLLERAVEKNIITKYGASYSYNDIRIGKSREETRKYLKENLSDFNDIAEKLKNICISA